MTMLLLVADTRNGKVRQFLARSRPVLPSQSTWTQELNLIPWDNVSLLIAQIGNEVLTLR